MGHWIDTVSHVAEEKRKSISTICTYLLVLLILSGALYAAFHAGSIVKFVDETISPPMPGTLGEGVPALLPNVPSDVVRIAHLTITLDVTTTKLEAAEQANMTLRRQMWQLLDRWAVEHRAHMMAAHLHALNTANNLHGDAHLWAFRVFASYAITPHGRIYPESLREREPNRLLYRTTDESWWSVQVGFTRGPAGWSWYFEDLQMIEEPDERLPMPKEIE